MTRFALLRAALLRAAFLWAALLVGGCGLLPKPLGTPPAPEAQVAVPVSSVHYRGYADAEALAAALRWRPGADVLVSAHRGGPRPGLPENSLPAFDHALNYAPALLETDVRRLADGTFVLLHDDTLDRTTTGTGEVADDGVHLWADIPSEAPTQRALVGLLMRTYDGATPDEVAAIPDDLLRRLGIDRLRGVQRQIGFAGVLRRLKHGVAEASA